MTLNDSRKLDSWKEIADYLQRDERTAMRWAKLGMPVHRSPAERRGRVFAYIHEIEEWLQAQGPAALNHSPVPPASPPATAPSIGSPVRGSPAGRRVARVAVALVCFGLMGWLAAYGWHHLTAQPASFQIEDSKLRVFDQSGRPMWAHDFGKSIHVYSNSTAPAGLWSAFADLDHDGNVEFLMILGAQDEVGAERKLVCFDRRGGVLWEYRPDRTVRYGDSDFAPPYSVDFFRLIVESDGKVTVWAVAHQLPWFPTVLAKIDSRGTVLAEYWHAGHIETLAEARLLGRRVILLGGMNNEHRAASLSVLDYDRAAGSSPAARLDYSCLNCPSGRPLNYIVFPRSEITRALDARDTVSEIWVRSGFMEVMVKTSATVGTFVPATSYSFNEDLSLRSAEVVDNYVLAHNGTSHAWGPRPPRGSPARIAGHEPSALLGSQAFLNSSARPKVNLKAALRNRSPQVCISPLCIIKG